MDDSLHYLLMRANAIMQKRILSQAYEYGLTAGQPKILYFLAKQDGIDQKTIAMNCEIEPATVGSILLRMENVGLIVRRKKEGNRRSLYVYMTDKGKKALEHMQTIFDSVFQEASVGMSAGEIKVLECLLNKLYSNLSYIGLSG